MERLALGGVFGLVLGVVLGSTVSLGWSGVIYFIGLALIFGGLYRWKQLSVYLCIAVFLAGCSVGMARMLFVQTTLSNEFVPLLDQEVTLEGVVVTNPDLRETTQRITIAVEREGKTERVLAVAHLYPSVSYGERIQVRGLFEQPEPFATDGGRTFAYDQFLAKDGIFALVSDANVAVLEGRHGIYHLVGILADVKRIGMSALTAALPEPHASLASGLILGGKQGLGESLLDDFIRSGLIHIVVLSGYNVMIVAEFILRLFGFLPKRKAAGIAAVTIGLFVLIAGAGAASIRAGIMAGIALYGRATGRTYDAFRALVLAGVVMMLISPLSLLYDPGFQLSFIATLGLIFGAPLVEARLGFIKSDFLRETVAATIAAQAAVLPLLLYQNGLFSVVALPANILVLPLVPLAMLTSFIAGIVGVLFPAVAPIFGLPAYLLLSYIIAVVEFTSSLPLAAFSIPAFPGYIALAAYAASVFVVYRLTTSQTQAHASQSRSS